MSTPNIDPKSISLIGFPGLIGAQGGIAIPAPGNLSYGPDHVLGWAQAIVKAAGQTNGRDPVAADNLLQTLASHLDASREQGLFALPVPTPGETGVLARYIGAPMITKGVDGISGGATRWTANMRESQYAAIEAWNKLPKRVTINNTDTTDGIWFLGPLSHSTLSKSGGNNIVYASPIMYQSNWHLTEEDSIWFGGYDRQHTMTSFFPSAQGKYQSNKLSLGDGNDIVYFDSSFAMVKGGGGHNTFVPSFGSFNWAFNAVAPQNPQNEGFAAALMRKPALFDQTIFLVNPVPLDSTPTVWYPQGRDTYNYEDVYGLAIQQYSKASGYTVQGRQVYYQGKPSAANNTDNHIGGQTLIGGKGNDTFYGLDPAFYAAVKAQVLNGKSWGSPYQDFHIDRYVFRDPAGDTKNERFNVQKFETVRMFGGEGADVFYLGNPNHISPDGLNFTGSATYIIAGSHSEDGTEAARRSLNWGKHDQAPNTYVINVSNDPRSYTNTSSSFDPETKEDEGPIEQAKGVFELVASADEFLEKSGLGHIPYVAALKAGISLGVNVVETFSNIGSAIYKAFKPDPEPIVLKSEQLSMPLGNWKHQVQISDWSPSDVIRIAVDTTYKGPQYAEAQKARWKNIEMVIMPPDRSSETGQGTQILWKAGETSQPIVRLDHLKGGDTSQNFGYAAYDYNLGQQVWIGSQHMDFFGNIALGVPGIEPLKNYTANNGFVFASSAPGVASASPGGSYTFYWNDKGALGDQGLDDARQKSSAITIEFDSRKLGWHWQPAFKLVGTAADADPQAIMDGLTLDPQASRLWILGKDGEWGYHSFSDFDTQVPAMIDALRSTTFYQTVYKGVIEKETRQIANEKMIQTLTQLQNYLSDLGDLQQRAGADQALGRLAEVMYANPGPNGLDLYYAKDGQSLMVTLSRQDGQATATAPRLLDQDERVALEKQWQVDLSGNGLIGDLDAVLATVGSPGVQATNSYVNLLDRVPSVDELRDIVGRLEPAVASTVQTDTENLVRIAQTLVQSDEFLQRYDDHSHFIEDLHLDLLQSSSVSQEDMAYWQGLLDAGFSRADIAWIVSNSSQFTERMASAEVQASLVGTLPDLTL